MAKKAKGKRKGAGGKAATLKTLQQAHEHLKTAMKAVASAHAQVSGSVPPFNCSPVGGGKYWKCWWDPVEQAYVRNCELVDASECQGA